MPEERLLTFEEAMELLKTNKKRHLLLGNGFSIALEPRIFSYGSLYENADFSKAHQLRDVFTALKTTDFEAVIRHLQDAATIIEVYRPRLTQLSRRLRENAALLKDALVSAIAKRHPDRPYNIPKERYAACRAFLSRFDNIFTLNYDVLLYWALMQKEVDDLNLTPDDGFRHPEDDPDLPYVSWQQGNTATVSFLHGALHLFDQHTSIIKYTWSKTDKAIVDQVREALDEDKFPLFVSEGSYENKWERILHNAYLHKCFRSFEQCCATRTAAIVIFGHSLHEYDRHILRCIPDGGASHLLVSIHGDPSSRDNQEIVNRANELVALRAKRRGSSFPLTVRFYGASSARVWG